jgi:hypothetical protein
MKCTSHTTVPFGCDQGRPGGPRIQRFGKSPGILASNNLALIQTLAFEKETSQLLPTIPLKLESDPSYPGIMRKCFLLPGRWIINLGLLEIFVISFAGLAMQ